MSTAVATLPTTVGGGVESGGMAPVKDTSPQPSADKNPRKHSKSARQIMRNIKSFFSRRNNPNKNQASATPKDLLQQIATTPRDEATPTPTDAAEDAVAIDSSGAGQSNATEVSGDTTVVIPGSEDGQEKAEEVANGEAKPDKAEAAVPDFTEEDWQQIHKDMIRVDRRVPKEYQLDNTDLRDSAQRFAGLGLIDKGKPVDTIVARSYRVAKVDSALRIANTSLEVYNAATDPNLDSELAQVTGEIKAGIPDPAYKQKMLNRQEILTRAKLQKELPDFIAPDPEGQKTQRESLEGDVARLTKRSELLHELLDQAQKQIPPKFKENHFVKILANLPELIQENPDAGKQMLDLFHESRRDNKKGILILIAALLAMQVIEMGKKVAKPLQ